MNYDYGLACVIMSSTGSLVGTILIQKLIKHSGRNSILILLLAGVLLVANIVIPVDLVFKLVNKSSKGEDIWGFGSAC